MNTISSKIRVNYFQPVLYEACLVVNILGKKKIRL